MTVNNARHLKSAARKRLFLDNYAQTGNITVAATAAGVDRTSYYLWCEHDDEFKLAAATAAEQATDILEEEARRRAYNGVVREEGVYYQGEQCGTKVVTEYSDTLLIFLLKARRPDKYRDNINVTQTQTVKVLDKEAWDAV